MHATFADIASDWKRIAQDRTNKRTIEQPKNGLQSFRLPQSIEHENTIPSYTEDFSHMRLPKKVAANAQCTISIMVSSAVN